MADKGTVGVIGLGIMGGAIARNLAAAGWTVVGFDIDTRRAAEIGGAGVEIAVDAGEVIRRAPVILTALAETDALMKTGRAIAASGASQRVVAELGTFSVDEKYQARDILSAAGHVALDCPISGTGAQAKARDLAIYASGDAASIEKIRPLLLDFSRDVRNVGDFGNGSKIKLVANLLVAIHNVAAAEAFALGMKAGIAPEQILELIQTGAGNSRVFELRGPMMAAGRYDEPTMKLSVWQKDMALIGRLARETGARTPLLDAAAPIYDAAIAQGLGGQDTAAVCAILEEMAGIKRRPQ